MAIEVPTWGRRVSQPEESAGTSPGSAGKGALETRGPLAPVTARTMALLDLVKGVSEMHDRLANVPAIAPETDFLRARAILMKHADLTVAAMHSIGQALSVQAGTSADGTRCLANALEGWKSRVEGTLSSTTDSARMRRIYDTALNDMSEGLIAAVRRDFFGWNDPQSRNRNFAQALGQCRTINEILHVVHTSIMQNEELLRSLSVWGRVANAEGQALGVGVRTELGAKVFGAAAQLFKTLPSPALICLAHPQGVHIMLRDFGHAATIDIEADAAGVARVRYYLPKTFGRESVKHLPGFDFHDDQLRVAKGSFYVAVADAPRAVTALIPLMPTDENHFPTGRYDVPLVTKFAGDERDALSKIRRV